MTAITGSNGNDLLTGTAGSDTINSGNGDDSVSGGAGNDTVNGGAGNDTLDGGSGSDQLNGGSGNDTLVYNVSENIAAGTKDVYTGGAGVDTLELQLTRAQWLESATQTQIAAYLAHLAAVTNARTGEVSNGSASDFVFRFGSSTLTIQMTEALRVLVDGVELNTANEAVRALGDAGTTTEDGPGVQIHVLQNDLVPDLVKSLTLASAPTHGTATLVQPAMDDPSTWYFRYQPRSADFQHLAAGETATDTFTYEVKDADGGTGLATATVTITGTNDGPVITAQDLAGAVSEQLTPAGQLSDSGVIGFSDADLSDMHLVSATGTPIGSVLGSLTAVMDSDSTGTGTGGQLTWTYTVDATAVEYLAAGETRVESFTITLDDQHGGLVTRQIDVTITGTNDVPAIGAADASGAVTEDAATPTLSDSGMISFDDVDLSDAHSVSVAVDPGNTLGGVLTAVVGDAATGAGDGTVSWNYSVANAATQYLAAGQTATETFTVSINDGHGGTVNQQITVTITGTNDVPVIGGVASGAVQEDLAAAGGGLAASGALTIADVDAGQSNFAPQASTIGSNGYGNFTLAADGNWTYTADNSQAVIQQLGAGQSISDSFTAVSSDGTASQVVTVTITGTNDVPVIGGVADGTVSEDGSTPNLSTSGALAIFDVDAGESSFAPQASTTGSSGHGSFTLAVDGNWTYTADNSQAAIQQLGVGESLSDSFTAVSSDGTASQVVTVTITGTNDVPVIGGVASGAVSEDASATNLSTGGALTIADVDAGQSNFAPLAGTAGSNGYGSFSLLADGTWTYTADNSQAAVQQLGAGQSISDSFTAVSSDGTASQVVTVTIAGTNDVPVIGGVASGAVSEDAAAPNLSTSGALTIADVDQGQSNFAPQASTAGSNGHGSFSLLADGSWTYTANNSQAAIQQLGAGQSISDSFTAVSSDGAASQVVTVTITGTNDVPVIGGVASGAVQEDVAAAGGSLAASGALTIADVDAGQSSFTAQAGTTGSNGYGSFTLAADGNWSYTADNSQAAIQQLGAGQSLSDSFTAVSSDGTASQVVTVTITGTNDVPVIGGVASGAVSEDVSTPNLSTSGALTIADVDQGQSNFTPQASTAGSNGYGSFSLLADGSWSYTANNSQAAIQQLGAGQSINDSFTAVSSDGSASQVVTVTITGTNDVPVIGGVASGAVQEDVAAAGGSLAASGALTIADVDQGQSSFAPQASTAGSNGYGNFTLTPDGTWSYTADNSQSAIQQLGAGQSISDSFTAISSDGAASQVVTVTITGTNDVPVIGGVASGAVNEDASVPILSTSGALTIADVDQGQSNFAPQPSTSGSNGYGSFNLLADGSWSYTADNSQGAIQQLGAGESISDSFTAVSSDGTASQVVTVTITGTNDVPVIGGVASGAVSEDASTPNLSTSGALTIADVDQGQSNFAPQAGTNGSNGYGSFTLAADGAWTYAADNNQSAIQQLGAGQSLSDSFTAVSSDGTASQVVTVTIAGTNDVPVIGGAASGAVSEDASTPNLSTSGALTIADVDQDQSNFAPQASTAGDNGYGSFSLLADGSWSYSASNSQAAIQQLGAGQSLTDSFTAVSSDGTASQVVTVTITGTNDVPVIGGVASGAVNEDASTPNLSTSGALTIADVDAGESSFTAQAGTLGNNGYGSFTLAADGAWTYAADNNQSAIQQLGAGQSISDSFTAVSSDGTASQVVTVTIAGTNDVPVIGGVASGAVSEDASTPNLSASGALTIADVDAGESSFAPQAGTNGSNGYGSFTLAADGSWSFTADNSQAAIQQLGAGQSISDSFTAVSSDGTASQVVTVTITGTNDVPVIGGVTSGAVSEDASTPNLSTSGALTIADVDAGESSFAPQAGTNGSNGYGSFTLAADGSWSFTADNSQAAIQQLGAGQSISDSFTAVSSDGTASQVVTVTITGTNDVPVIAGVASGAVQEDVAAAGGSLAASGALTIADVDAGQSNFTPQASTAGSNGHGSFSLLADGSWSYTADNSQSAIQQLGAGQSLTDSFTAVSSDGTASQLVTVTITGTNDVPVIGGVASGAVSEDASTPNLSTSGALTIADVDAGQSNFTAQAGAAGSNGYGSFTLAADGNWTYTADNSQAAIQQLGAGQSISDSFIAVSSDGTASQVVTVTITGTNDVPVIGGAASGAVQEDVSAAGGSLSASGALTIADVDAGQSNFTAQAGTAGSNGYGSFTLAANGSWTYTADNSQAAIQQLSAGQSITESFTAVSSDGTASQVVTVTITGTNDVPVIGGVASGAVSEDASTPNLSTSGALTIADVDQGQSNFAPQASTAGSNGYGSFALAADGSWTYTAGNSQAAIQQLGAGQSISDSFIAVSSDGTANQVVTVTITGTNDVPVIGGVASGAVKEDVAAAGGTLAASGALTIADVDAGQSNFASQASTAGSNGYGSFTLAADGTWTYTANNSQSAIQQLGAGQSLSDSFTAVSSDGTASQVVTVTITGTNDVAVIGGVASGAVQEDVAATGGSLAASGALTIADVDAGQSNFAPQASTTGSNGYGSFTLAADGNWTYTANNSQAAIQQLGAGQSLSDSFTAVSSDGTASQVVTVTIAGSNDAPVLSAAATPILASVSEDAGAPVGAVGTLVSSLVNLNPPAGGLDNVSDADNGAITGIALTGVNGANGSWWYSTNGGATWATVGAVSNSSALLLAADANTRVYFQGNSNFSGTVSDGITFRAWDQTSGTAGTTVSTVTNGGSTAFSSATESANITVQAVNDNPLTANDVLYVSNNTAVRLPTSVLLANDTDIDGAALSVTAISVMAGTLATPVTINADGTFSFTTGATGGTVASPTVVTLSYTLSDGAGGTATGAITLNVLDTTSGGNTVDLTGVANYQGSYIDGKSGGDTLRDGAFQSVLVGSDGNDELNGNAGSDLLIGGDNNDNLNGGAGNDVLRGGAKNDDIDGGAGTEDLIDFSDPTIGTGITFTLTQSSSNTTFNGPGSLGTDTYRNIEGVIGTDKADTLTGSASNDIIRGGGGNDTLDGAGGTDLVDFSDATGGINFTLVQSTSNTNFSAAGVGTDTYKNFEGVIGTAFADTITGSASNDELRGGGGNDVINGLAGDDRIVGGTGADILTGGADNDTFVFDSAPNAVDSVTDFDASGSPASGDLVELSLGTFTALSTASGSTLAASEFASVNGGGAGDAVGAGVHVIYDSATGSLYYDSDGLGAANRTLVATLTLSNPGDTFDNNDIKVGA